MVLCRSVATSSPYTRLLLRKIYRETKTGTVRLGDALADFGDGRVNSTASGNQIIAASGGGKTVTFAAPSPDFSQVDLAETASRLLDLYDVVSPSIGTAVEDNAAVFAAMMARLNAVRTIQTRFSCYQP